MKRRLLNLLTALSLLLFLAAVTLWVRSYIVAERWQFAERPAPPVKGVFGKWVRQRWFGWGSGRVALCDLDMLRASDLPFADRMPVRPPPKLGYQREVVPGAARGAAMGGRARGEVYWSVPGFTYYRRPAQLRPAPTPRVAMPGGGFLGDTIMSGQRFVAVSWWLPALAFAVAPTLAAWRWHVRRVRTRRSQKRLCPTCGYDLRATPDQCPECGSPRNVVSPG